MTRRHAIAIIVVLVSTLSLLGFLAWGGIREREDREQYQTELLERLDRSNELVLQSSRRNARLVTCIAVNPAAEPPSEEIVRACLERAGFNAEEIDEVEIHIIPLEEK